MKPVMKRRIAIFIPTIKSGGAEKQACLLAKSLAGLHDVSFVSFYGRENAEEGNLRILESEPGISFVECRGSKFQKLRQVHDFLRSRNIEILFDYLTFCDVFGAIVGRLAGVPHIVGGIRNSRLPYGKFLAERFIHNHFSSETIFNCRSGAEYFSGRGFNKNKMAVIHNCFENIAPALIRKDKEVKGIISVGRFVPQKNYHASLEAVKLLSGRRRDFTYTIVGYGPLEMQIREWVRKMDLDDLVRIIIRPSNVPELLNNADIYLSTSKFEGTSNSIMEAMNASLPVVATDVGDNDVLISDKNSGVLHHEDDIESFASSLDNLLSDRRLRLDYGLKGHEMLENQFSAELFLEKYQNLINTLI